MRKPIRIAYLEDDLDQGNIVTKWLNAQAIQCDVYSTVEALKSALVTNAFDAIMLDVEINGEAAGLSMLGHIRKIDCNDTPILMVSAEAYWREALTSGADDFLEKPLTAKKLLIHIYWLLRPIDLEATIEDYPPYQLNSAQQQITLEGNRVELSADEYELASTLFRYFGKVLSNQQLIEKMSGPQKGTSSQNIEKDVLRLKRKMNLRDIDGWRLESVYRHGYRLANAQYNPCGL